MNLQEIRDLTRTHLDLEQDDLGDPLIDTWAREASHRIELAERYWPFYKVTKTFTIPASSVSSLVPSIDNDLTEIASISRESDGYRLEYLGINEFEERHFGTASGGNVCFFALWGDSVFWGPPPGSDTIVTVRGFRRPIDWVGDGAGAEPDFPVELHNTVVLWVTHKAYAQQEDLEASAQYERMFADELNLYRRRFTQTNMTAPMVLGGNRRRRILGRFPYDWE